LVPAESGTGMTDPGMNFQTAAPKIPPRILCIGMPVRDLTFRIDELPARGFKVNASHFDEKPRAGISSTSSRMRASTPRTSSACPAW